MKKKIFTLILALIMLLCTIPAAATETTEPAESTQTTEPTTTERDPGYCGETIVWSFSGGVLNITGTGPMDDFPNGAPWEEYKSQIGTVIISGGITYVGAYSFYNYDNLTSVQFGNDIVEIGDRAFLSCDGLTVVYLPASFKIFGPACFMGCSRLKEFHCEGVFPTFQLNCLWDTYAIIYFPADRPWGLEYIMELEEAFHGRIEFLASDGTDPYESDIPTVRPGDPAGDPEETEEPTEAPTTVPPTTVPPTTVAPTTQAPTTQAPTTEAATESSSEAATEPILIMPKPTETDPEPQETTGENQGPTGPERIVKFVKTVILWSAVGGAVLFLLIRCVVFGCGRKRGKFER